jgi:hypothetical protein
VIVDGDWNLTSAQQAAQAVDFMETTYRSVVERRIIEIETRSR